MRRGGGSGNHSSGHGGSLKVAVLTLCGCNRWFHGNGVQLSNTGLCGGERSGGAQQLSAINAGLAVGAGLAFANVARVDEHCGEVSLRASKQVTMMLQDEHVSTAAACTRALGQVAGTSAMCCCCTSRPQRWEGSMLLRQQAWCRRGQCRKHKIGVAG